METIATSLHHLIREPRPRGGSPEDERHPTVILLHGRGADEHDLLGLAEHLDPRLMFISARAPFPFEHNMGFTWYDILDVGRPEPEMFRTSYDKLVTFVTDVRNQYPVDTDRLFLLGFSMGTMMSFSLALTHPEWFRGVVANSGYIPEGTHLTFRWKELGGIEFFVAHGVLDPVIPVAFGRQARERLAAANASFVYREYPMAHQISEESLRDMAVWLAERLNKRKD